MDRPRREGIERRNGVQKGRVPAEGSSRRHKSKRSGLDGLGGGGLRGSFSARLISGRVPGKVEGAVAAAVMGSVFAVAFLIFNMPGPLVVQVRDDQGTALPGAKVTCVGPDGERRFSGVTDVFGEAKWPGLARGPWRCQVWPPERFFGEKQEGSAVVQARSPAIWRAQVERPARVLVQVKRPPGAPRSQLAVRAVCPGPASWEARSGLLDGNAVLWLPHGRTCRVGLVRPELPPNQPGPPTEAKLDCANLPCSGDLSGGVGAELAATLEPSAAQWEAARPPPEPDREPPAATPAAPASLGPAPEKGPAPTPGR